LPLWCIFPPVEPSKDVEKPELQPDTLVEATSDADAEEMQQKTLNPDEKSAVKDTSNELVAAVDGVEDTEEDDGDGDDEDAGRGEEDDTFAKPRKWGLQCKEPVKDNATKNWEKGHTCPHCPSIFRDEASFYGHLLKVHKSIAHYLEKVTTAPVQKITPLSSDNLQGKWRNDNVNSKSYKCSECGKMFRHRSVLELHMRIHSKDKPYQCKVCGKRFRFSSYLQQHLIIHTGKKPHKCPDCGKDFAFLQNMKTHQKLHQEKPFRCTSCRKGYSDEAQLQHHMLSHNGEKPHKCDLCDKSFGLAYLLRDHMNTHTGERPHRCDECHKSFSWFSSLLVHQKIHAHDAATKFPCEECGKVFMTLTFYYKHQRLAHSDETPAKSFLHQVCQLQKKAFECKDCGLKFSRASALHSHQLHHTDVFRDAEKEAQIPTSPLPQHKFLEGKREEGQHLAEEVRSQDAPRTTVAEEDCVIEIEEDMDSYETGDFNVEVISVSGSDEEEPLQDLNPDLELLCESDQELKEDIETELSPSSLVSKPEIDLKIVQVDFEKFRH
uniref:C2H2-type domain-containing protein n=1 Tax=Myripristis murdjan TaxID=586833 RepID=A0A667YWJ1_9TELE